MIVATLERHDARILGVRAVAYRDAATYDEVRVTRLLRRRIEALIAENKPPRRRRR